MDTDSVRVGNADQALIASDQASVPCLGPPGFDPSRGDCWTENYVDDAATARVTIRHRRPDGSVLTEHASNYDPPSDGIHLCGVTDDGEQPTTVAVYHLPPEAAPYAWQLAREVAECDKDEGDFIVDLCIDDSIVDDFWSSRQLWTLAIRAWNAASGTEAGTGETPLRLDPKGDSPVPERQTPNSSPKAYRE